MRFEGGAVSATPLQDEFAVAVASLAPPTHCNERVSHLNSTEARPARLQPNHKFPASNSSQLMTALERPQRSLRLPQI